MDSTIAQGFKFFRNMGSSAEAALDLARAEVWGEGRLKAEWSFDELFSPDDFEGGEDVKECLVLRLVDTVTGDYEVLGGICDADRAFGRLCEAELASELMCAAAAREMAQTIESERRF